MEFRKWASRFIAVCYTAATFAYPLDFALAQATPVPPAVPQFSDANGNPLASGTVGFYQPGTLSPKTVWQDSGQTTPYSNPITLNAAGEPSTTNGPNGIWGTGTYRQIVLDSNGNPIWDALTATSAASSSGSSGDGMPLGFVMPFAGSIAPSGYDFAYGQAYSRTAFASLLAALSITQSSSCVNGSAIVTGLSDTSQMGAGQALESGCFPSSTTVSSVLSSTSVQASTTATGVTGTYSFQVFPFGNGNGSTTFNLPDLRGYVPAGRDNMGGSAAGRLTSASKPGGWDYLGATGGVDALTLSTAQLPSHNHEVLVSDPGHVHYFTYSLATLGSGGAQGVTTIDPFGDGTYTSTQGGMATIGTPAGSTGITATTASAGGGTAVSAALGLGTSFGLTNASVSFGGVSYSAGTLTVQGGTCTTQPQVVVTVSGGKVATISSISTPGVCSIPPVNPAVLSDGTHTTATILGTYGNGSGYTTGAQVLTVLGGTCSVQPQVNVTVAGGSVVAVSGISVAGACTSPPVNPAATSGGGGTGAQLAVAYSTAATAIVQPTQTLNYIVKVSANSGGYTIPIANNTVLGNFSGMTAPPVATAPNTVLNFVCGTRGALYEVGAGGAGCLPPAAIPGYVLTSNGTGADPTYQPLPGGGPGGPVTGPASSTAGSFACWGNTSGTVLANCIAAPFALGISSAVVSSPGTGYAVGDVITPAFLGSSLTANGQLLVANTKVVGAAVASPGTGGAAGVQTVTGTTGTGTLFQASVNVSGGGITSVNSITVPGQYLVNPTNIANEPVTGAGLGGAALSVSMGVLFLQVQQTGSYSIVGSIGFTQGSTSGVGTGLTGTAALAFLASAVIPPSQASGSVIGNVWSTAYGFLALAAVTSGQENTALGWKTLSALTTGNFNTAVGVFSGGALTTGSGNTSLGTDSLRDSLTVSNNVAVGATAMRNPLDGANNNVAVGVGALLGQASTTGTDNVAIGFNAIAGTSWTTGSNNVAIGSHTGQSITSGLFNMMVGAGAGMNVTSGQGNTLIGINAGNAITTGSGNIFFGAAAGSLNTGNNNIAIGTSSLAALVLGNYNVAIGHDVGLSVIGSHNVLIGPLIVPTILTSGSDNIILGTESNCDTATGATSSTFLVCATSGSTPLLQGNLLAASLALQVNGTLGIPQATWADNQTCAVGQISVDASFIYVCTATNTVKRAALSSF